MKRIFLTLFLLSNFIVAKTYQFELTNKDIEYINNSNSSKFIKNRLKKYVILKKKIINYKLIRKLSYVNAFVNKIRPANDIDTSYTEDYWATPKEFLLKGYGDCEDYVITKYFTLLEVGIPKNKLYFAVVDVKGRKEPHMVLLYQKDKNKPPLVLDNLSSRILPFYKRKRLIPKVAFNEINAYKFTPNQFTQKVNINWGGDNKWEKLLKRVYKLKE